MLNVFSKQEVGLKGRVNETFEIFKQKKRQKSETGGGGACWSSFLQLNRTGSAVWISDGRAVSAGRGPEQENPQKFR